MEKLNHEDLDKRIHGFLTRKTSQGTLSQAIADWISGLGSSGKSSERSHYRGQSWAEYVLKTR